MCGQGKYIDNFTKEELEEIFILRENCAKENQTEEDIKQAIKEWSKTVKGKISKKESLRKYTHSEKGKETRRKYRESEKGKEICKKSIKKYRESEHGKQSMKESIKKYCESEHGKQKKKRIYSK